jgi:hypothetical protein
MSRVVSFKVDEKTYFKLKHLKISFKDLFEPISSYYASKINTNKEYTESIRQSNPVDGTIGNDLKMIVKHILEVYSNDNK